MVKVTKKQIADVFRAAKKNLWNGKRDRPWAGSSKREYICHAINRSGDNRPAEAAKNVILDRIAPRCAFDSWLGDQPGVKTADITQRRVQQHRHAWLDMLIKEFDK